MRRALAIAVNAAALAGPAPAQAADCVTDPGDAAPKRALAAWMAYGAAVRGVPGELPVMAALVESGMTNLSYGQADSVGFFAMRTSIWNQGEYAGYRPTRRSSSSGSSTRRSPSRQPGSPPILDTVRPRLAGESGSPTSSGPRGQNRGAYQPRLQESRELSGPGCTHLTARPQCSARRRLTCSRPSRTSGAPASSRWLASQLGCPARARLRGLGQRA